MISGVGRFFVAKYMSDRSSISISVCIPAYNEAANIGRLLGQILEQRFSNSVLDEVIVYSDHSTDNTVKETRSIHDKRVRIIEGEKRVGANAAQNILLTEAGGDAIILLNADIRLSGEYCLDALVRKLRSNQSLGIVAARVESLPGQGWFERVMAMSHAFKTALYEGMFREKKEVPVYLCHGRARVFSRKFGSMLRWPDQCPEDAYSYFLCQQLGFHVGYAWRSVVFFRSPAIFPDFLKQSHRFRFGRKKLEKSFSVSGVRNAYALPFRVSILTACRFALRFPEYFLSYIILFVWARLRTIGRPTEQSQWDPAKTSKTLQ